MLVDFDPYITMIINTYFFTCSVTKIKVKLLFIFQINISKLTSQLLKIHMNLSFIINNELGNVFMET